MSLIEKAIEKARSGSLASHGGVAGPFGRVVTPVTPRSSEAGRHPAASGRIVEINEAALRSAGLLPPEHQARSIAREYQQIKRPLVANAYGRGVPRVANGNIIMIASAVPGEGKTFTSLNLAFSLALERDIHVVLVDADVPKPHVSKLLGVDREPGLLDALLDSGRDVESLILPSSVHGLSILPVGTRAENPTELLASERMEELVKRMGEYDPHRIVLFDSPPLLLTTESQALTHVMGQIIIVVRAGVTPQRAVLDALSHVGEGRHVALVLNQSVTVSPTNYYHYGKDGNGLDGAHTD